MILLPDPELMYQYETNFHLTFNAPRLSKILVHYEAIKLASTIPGEIVECGVFKGTSFIRLGLLRNLILGPDSARLIGFDTFGDEYPTTAFSEDFEQRERWIRDAGSSSISVDQLSSVLERANIINYELIAGDVSLTIPNYLKSHPEFRISLLNVDIDFLEPTQLVLELLYPRISFGGIVLLDNYGAFHGDTIGADIAIQGLNERIHRFSFANRPCYFIKGDKSVTPNEMNVYEPTHTK